MWSSSALIPDKSYAGGVVHSSRIACTLASSPPLYPLATFPLLSLFLSLAKFPLSIPCTVAKECGRERIRSDKGAQTFARAPAEPT